MRLTAILQDYVGDPGRFRLTTINKLLGIPPIDGRVRAPPTIWHAAHGAAVSAIWACRCKALHDNTPAVFNPAAVEAMFLAKLSRILAVAPLFSSLNLNLLRALV